MSDIDYNLCKIHVNPFAEIEESEDGICEQSWDILLNLPFDSQIDLRKISKLISHENYEVLLSSQDNINLIASVTYIRDDNPYGQDPSAVAHFRLFREVEELLGSINTIQGLRIEEWWRPKIGKSS
jgi:hypothetical protein